MGLSVLKLGKFWANWDELVTLIIHVRKHLLENLRICLGTLGSPGLSA